jgi:hypothetical protein
VWSAKSCIDLPRAPPNLPSKRDKGGYDDVATVQGEEKEVLAQDLVHLVGLLESERG